jgi:cytosine/adenosine deaminase-related metal-dependent hydrolase
MSVPFNPKNFKDILEQLWWKLDGKLDCDDVYSSGLVYGIDCIKNGVTSLIDHHASGLCIKGSLEKLQRSVCDDLGLRGIFCFETSDRFDVDECIEENLEFSRSRSQNCAGLFGMHASMSLEDETLRKIGHVLGDLPIHIHVAESIDDVEHCRANYGDTIVKRLEKFGLLNKNSILSHCVHISPEEAELIADNGCMTAMNPTSNMNNAVGLADYEIFRRSGVNCMIGNDGLGANITREYLNIVFAMKNRLKSPTKFGFDDLLAMIENGYEYINKMLNIKIGRIEKGYKADMIAVPYIPPTPMDEGNAFGHVFFGIFDNFHPRNVWANGECLMKDYSIRFSTDMVYEDSRVLAQKVWERISKI